MRCAVNNTSDRPHLLNRAPQDRGGPHLHTVQTPRSPLNTLQTPRTHLNTVQTPTQPLLQPSEYTVKEILKHE